MYVFLEATDFIGQPAIYFKEKEVHLCSSIQTVGQIIYTSDNIVLKALSGEKEVIVHFLNNLVPEDGSLVQLYGHLSFFQDLRNMAWFNFDDDSESVPNLILNIECWKNLHNEAVAKKLERLLLSLNYEI